jgi:uncharacterized protein YdcH (DUF465 family)
MTLDIRQTLQTIFPDDGEMLHALKLDNSHFRALSERHDALSKAIYRIETDIETLKKERLAVLDDVAALIAERRKQDA